MGGSKAPVKDTNKLFDVVLVVELQQGNDGKNVPFISYRYPSLFETDPFTASVTQFCFPDINQFPTETMENETFSFVLTEGDGERRFGYCTRRLPSGTGPRYPIAYSIMTYFPCFPLYTKILHEVSYRYENISMKDLTQLVESIWQRPFPAPAETFEIKLLGEATYFTRPSESGSQLEHLDVRDFLSDLDDRNIMIIFVSILLERRIIFCATKLSTLSSCIQVAVAMCYPFTWQHIYIPVLPKSLLSFVCAPMPFVVGILRSELPEVLSLPMNEVLIIDIDKNDFIQTPWESDARDLNLLPGNFVTHLRRTIRNATKVVKKQQKRKKEKKMDDMQLKQMDYEMKILKEEMIDTFIQFFVIILTGYRDHIQNSVLDKDAFISAQPQEMQPFMKALTGAQMFECFLEERRTGMADTAFERRIDQNEMLGEKLLKLGIGGDKVDSLVPQFGLDKDKKANRSSAKKDKLISSWVTLRSQFKMSTEESTAPQVTSASPPKATSVDNQMHLGPQFVLPQLSVTGPNSCPTSPSQHKLKPLPKPQLRNSSSESLDLNPISVAEVTTGRSNLVKSAAIPPRPVAPKSNFILKTQSTPTLEIPKQRSRAIRNYNIPQPKNIEKPFAEKSASEKPKNPLSFSSPQDLPRPPEVKRPPHLKRPSSQEYAKGQHIQPTRQFSKDAESIKNPIRALPTPNTQQPSRGRGRGSWRANGRGRGGPPRGATRGAPLTPRSNSTRGTPSRELSTPNREIPPKPNTPGENRERGRGVRRAAPRGTKMRPLPVPNT